MKVTFYTLGCRVNNYETELMKQQFIENGYMVIDFPNIADIYVINSCSVTNLATRKTRQFLSKAKHINPQAIVVLVGCYAQEIKDDFENGKVKLPYVDIVIGNEEKNDIIDNISKKLNKKNEQEDLTKIQKNIDKNEIIYNISDINKIKKYNQRQILKTESRIRADVKIEDGCNNFCSYCIIPYVRGRIRSRNIDDIELEVRNLVKANIKEIVLVGIEIASYGQDLKQNIGLIDVLERLDNIEGLKRVRLGSMYPTYFTDDIILRLAKLKKLCHHFHLSIQSLDDQVLYRMNRKYKSKLVFDIVDKLRNNIKDITFSCDIIVGFPQESDKEFQNTVNGVKKIGFSHVHVFKYSKRKYTKAKDMIGQIDGNVANLRSEKLIEISKNITTDILNSYIGTTQQILFDTYKSGYLYGYSDNYLKVKVRGDKKLWATIQDIKLISLEEETLLGTF